VEPKELTDAEVEALLAALVYDEPSYEELLESLYRTEVRYAVLRGRLKELSDSC